MAESGMDTSSQAVKSEPRSLSLIKLGVKNGLNAAKSIASPQQPPSWKEQRQKLKKELNPHKYNLDKDPFELAPGIARSDPIADLILGYANSGNRDVANSLNQIYDPMLKLLKSYDLDNSIKTRIESLLLRGNKPVIYRLAVELAERQGVLAKSLPEKSHDHKRASQLSAFGLDVALQIDREWNLRQEKFGPPRIKKIKEGSWKDFIERRLLSKEFEFKLQSPQR